MDAKLALIILAAGRGSRLKARQPKCLYKIGGRAMIDWALDNFKALNLSQKIIVVGYKKDILKKHLGLGYDYVWQKKLLGTGNAAKLALEKLNPAVKTVLVSNSDDAAFYKTTSLRKFLKRRQENNFKMSFLTVKLKTAPTVKSVIARDKNGRLLGLKPVKKGDKFFEVVCGAYLFNKGWLQRNISKIKRSPTSGEYPITDLIKLAIDKNINKSYAFTIDEKEWLGVNTPAELEQAKLKSRKKRR